jgi:5-methylcytosine-specific restriction endonuclease McrA
MTCSDVGGIMPYFMNDYLEQQIQQWKKLRLIDRSKRREEIKEIHRWASIYHLYKLTQKEWQAIFERQHGCCAICGKTQAELDHPLEIDQDRATGEIRGLLCRKCNSGIALLGDDIERLKKAIEYLQN